MRRLALIKRMKTGWPAATMAPARSPGCGCSRWRVAERADRMREPPLVGVDGVAGRLASMRYAARLDTPHQWINRAHR
ncbi:hypothetical protein [Microbispora sp. H11081]|uniref:hypothetical protein n=1 Tax=Microbispora sp. H11081 TaxID=2729107 RepID=UPI0014730EAD|nr:hypothetical protein [Microbispora sp. H11081]